LRRQVDGCLIHETRETLQQLWLKHAKGVDIDKPTMPLLSELVTAWSALQRHWRSLHHVQQCLQMLERRGRDAAARHEVGIALSFHDAVHDPRCDDNEEESARSASKAVKELGVGGDNVRRIGRLMLATRHRSSGAMVQTIRLDGLDLMLDGYLANLGSDRARLEEYERQVRLEDARLADDAFARSRADFVDALLGVSPLNRSRVARSELEPTVHASLTHSLGTWRRL
jgi:predicted metal-dependent HD superfamily phosphohydrolase